jgi:hypothetical protein
MRGTLELAALLTLCGGVVLLGPEHSGPPASNQPAAITATGIQNAFRLSDRVYSGSVPEGDAGFATLRSLGVRTVLSVDGMTPDVRTAARYGLRYVHIPIGYDGISREKAWQMARAVRDLPGPVYVHCHHGQHRGPAAAAAILLCLNPGYSADDATNWLTVAGTDPHYPGLIGLPRSLHRPTPSELDRVPAEFPPVAVIPDLARVMVAVDARWDHLKEAKAANWKRSAAQPDVDPSHEARQLRELYREAARLPDANRRDAGFIKLLTEAETIAGELEGALRSNPQRANALFGQLRSTCNRCHAAYRN